MFRTLTASVLAGIMALTPMTAKPAHAIDRELGTFLAGVGTLVIIGSLLDGRGHASVTTHPPVTHPYPVYPHPQPPVYPHRPVYPQPHRPVITPPPPPDRPIVRRHHLVLPPACLKSIQTHSSRFEYVERRCLAERVPAISLPNSCLRRVDGRNRDFTAYSAQCLRRSGYSI